MFFSLTGFRSPASMRGYYPGFFRIPVFFKHIPGDTRFCHDQKRPFRSGLDRGPGILFPEVKSCPMVFLSHSCDLQPDRSRFCETLLTLAGP